VLSDLPTVEGVEHDLVTTARLRVHVARAGSSGPPLVLLHGWPQHWYAWRYVIPGLAEHYRVFAPDLRGLGWTDAPPNGYENESLARDLSALLDALGLERVFLVGHDWGVHAGFLFCLQEPERASAFVALNDVHPWMRSSLRDLVHLWRFWYIVVLAAPFVGSWALRTRPGFVRLLIRSWSARHVWSEEELEGFARRLNQPRRARASVQWYRALLRELLPILRGRHRSQRLRTPTLLLCGSDDGVVRPHQLRGYEPYSDDMRVECLDGVGHFSAEEAPDAVVERTLAHFATVRD
jgi:pimeloyl-ACP methyl ester carboxylesterase